MSRIDPIRRTELSPYAAKGEPEAAPRAGAGELVRLPALVDRVGRVTPRADGSDGQAVFAAQLIGQDGCKRGLRAGVEVIDRARSLYNRTEWSGASDRRAPKGAYARTQV
jgi:hypothetical protein